MASFRAGGFGKRKATPPPEDVTERNMFPPSRSEQMQTRWMIITILVSLAVLVIGLTLRFTVFANLYKPQPVATSPTSISPFSSASPSALVTLPTMPMTMPTVSPSPSPITVATPKPDLSTPDPAVVPVTPTKVERTSEGDPISPSLTDTGGRVVMPR